MIPPSGTTIYFHKGNIMAARILIIGMTLSLLAACDMQSRDKTLSREHDAKAAQLCKKDKGLKRVVEASGKSFTAECNSGIVVTGTSD